MPPLVSVCIPAFNRESHLRETLDSVFAQTYPNVEVIVVDDASTDGTAEVARSYGDRMRVIQRTSNAGCADIPRAEAVASAQGTYCALLDSDDLWHPEKIERQMAVMQRSPEWAMSHTYVAVKDEYRGTTYVRHEGHVPDGPDMARALLNSCFICTSSVMVKRGVWLEAFAEVDPRTFGTEWEMFLAIAKKYPIGFLAEPLVTYRKAATGISQRNWKRVQGDILGRERIYCSGLWQGIATRATMRKGLIQSARDGSVYWRDRGEWGRALWFAGQGLKVAPWNGRLWLETGKAMGRAIRKYDR